MRINDEIQGLLGSLENMNYFEDSANKRDFADYTDKDLKKKEYFQTSTEIWVRQSKADKRRKVKEQNQKVSIMNWLLPRASAICPCRD